MLDPACGSGNFLYLALHALKDLEHRVQLEADAMGLPLTFPEIGPASVKGIEINPYAAELARVSVWIGEIQWMRRNGFSESRQPILKPLDTIECRDAILDAGRRRTRLARGRRGDRQPAVSRRQAVARCAGRTNMWRRCQRLYGDRIHGEADLVCHWFDKAGRYGRCQGKIARAGLVATNSIRGGRNRSVLDRIVELAERSMTPGRTSLGWWTARRCGCRLFALATEQDGPSARLDGRDVRRASIPTLTAAVDLTNVKRVSENAGIAFMGDTKGGAFDVAGNLAREWLRLPANPNGRPNSDVLKPWVNGMDLTRRPAGKWIIHFGSEMSEADAALYEAPFAYIAEHVRPVRQRNRIRMKLSTSGGDTSGRGPTCGRRWTVCLATS